MASMGLVPLVVAILFLLIMIFFSITSSSSTPVNVNLPIAKPGCDDYCGNISIPFPFGTREGCYLNSSYLVTCNSTAYNPPKLFLSNSTINITSISLDGQLRILKYITHDCYHKNGTRYPYGDPKLTLSIALTINNAANKLTAVGCDTYSFAYGYRLNGKYFETGCSSWCGTEEDLVNGTCSGLGCCQTSIPKYVWNAKIRLGSYNNFTNVSKFNNCSYGFVVEEGAFNFSSTGLSGLANIDKLPVVLDWAVGDRNCLQAQNNRTVYACKSTNSTCYDNDNGYGYRCYCQDGYEGNPYLDNGCQDIDECQESTLNNCEEGSCVNTQGGFNCECPKDYYGDATKSGKGCIRIVGEPFNYKVVGVSGVGLGLGIGMGLLLLFMCFWLYNFLKRRKKRQRRRKFFKRNGGLLLQQQMSMDEAILEKIRLFTIKELEKATDKFNECRILGQGGQGTVYKAMLSDGRIVAVKKSKLVDENQVEQFINEVVMLHQIIHKNVVKLLGCCLETEVPLLVYEFISNGNLFDCIHNEEQEFPFLWNMRLKIAVEVAEALAYLHSATSVPIYHRDVKSSNILLDEKYVAKISDFGTSRSMSVDQTHLTTLVKGTFGYLDPEYFQSSQFTEKSDVYSFGVVLVELLTGSRPISFDRTREERSLATRFLMCLLENKLETILDSRVLGQAKREELDAVANLAQRCLNLSGKKRPTMKQVAIELESIRTSQTVLPETSKYISQGIKLGKSQVAHITPDDVSTIPLLGDCSSFNIYTM